MPSSLLCRGTIGPVEVGWPPRGLQQGSCSSRRADTAHSMTRASCRFTQVSSRAWSPRCRTAPQAGAGDTGTHTAELLPGAFVWLRGPFLGVGLRVSVLRAVFEMGTWPSAGWAKAPVYQPCPQAR